MDGFDGRLASSTTERIRAFIRGPRLVRRVLLQHTVRYWSIRHRFDQALFRLIRAIYRIRTWTRDTHSAASLLTILTRAIAGQVLFACVLIAIAVLLERTVARYTRFHLPTPASSAAGVRDVLNTIAQISGIVLTLYYTAMSVVISTAYANVAADLRSLIIREKSSYLYVKLLALTCAGSLILRNSSPRPVVT